MTVAIFSNCACEKIKILLHSGLGVLGRQGAIIQETYTRLVATFSMASRQQLTHVWVKFCGPQTTIRRRSENSGADASA